MGEIMCFFGLIVRSVFHIAVHRLLHQSRSSDSVFRRSASRGTPTLGCLRSAIKNSTGEWIKMSSEIMSECAILHGSIAMHFRRDREMEDL